jgi:hypothetical protein
VRRSAVRVAVGVALAATLLAGYLHRRGSHADDALLQRMATAVALPGATPGTVAAPCANAGDHPLVLLVLGQSNAGNHGAEGEVPTSRLPPRVLVFDGIGCTWVTDPLPGATGRHQSIWSDLPARLAERGLHQPVVLALLAVDSTAMDDWTRLSSPLRLRLAGLMRQLLAAGLEPALVLWQQGEADALRGTSRSAYAESFELLRLQVRNAGVAAPIVLAMSTRCGAADGREVRAAVDDLLALHHDLRRGPDTDQLTQSNRVRNCHFSGTGLRAASVLWAQAIAGQVLTR